MSLYAAIAEAQAELGNLHRDKEVRVVTKGGGSYSYSYVTEEAITKAVRTILSPKGVAVLVSWDDVHHEGDLTTVRGRLIFAKDDERIEIGLIGTGLDSSDKGLNKAQTSAVRIGLCKTFLQAGDDDGEAVSEPRQRRQAQTAKPANKWEERFAEAVAITRDEDKVKALMNNADPQVLANDAAWEKLLNKIDELVSRGRGHL